MVVRISIEEKEKKIPWWQKKIEIRTLIDEDVKLLGTRICSSVSESSSELTSKSGGFRNVQPSSTNFKFDNWYVNVFIFAATSFKNKRTFLISSYLFELSN